MANTDPVLAKNIGQYCRCVALPILGQYCAQYLANVVQRVLPISAQYYGQHWPNIACQQGTDMGTGHDMDRQWICQFFCALCIYFHERMRDLHGFNWLMCCQAVAQ